MTKDEVGLGKLDSGWDFMIKVNGGEAQPFHATTGVYVVAVMEAFGKLGMPYPCDVEIWSDPPIPEYGPYFYRIADFVDNRGNVYGCPSVMHSRPIAASTLNLTVNHDG